MAGSGSLETQKAIYNALTGDATLMAKVSGVYDNVLENTAFPYVTVGEETGIDFSSCTNKGIQYTLTLHSWSRSRGRTEIKGIMSDVFRILHQASLTLTNGFTCVLIMLDYEEITQDPDGVTYHGIQRFKALVTN